MINIYIIIYSSKFYEIRIRTFILFVLSINYIMIDYLNRLLIVILYHSIDNLYILYHRIFTQNYIYFIHKKYNNYLIFKIQNRCKHDSKYNF